MTRSGASFDQSQACFVVGAAAVFICSEWSQSHAATAGLGGRAPGRELWGFHRQPASPHAFVAAALRREEAAARPARQRQSEGAPAQSLGEGGRAAAAQGPAADGDHDDDPLASRIEKTRGLATPRTAIEESPGGSDGSLDTLGTERPRHSHEMAKSARLRKTK